MVVRFFRGGPATGFRLHATQLFNDFNLQALEIYIKSCETQKKSAFCGIRAFFCSIIDYSGKAFPGSASHFQNEYFRKELSGKSFSEIFSGKNFQKRVFRKFSQERIFRKEFFGSFLRKVFSGKFFQESFFRKVFSGKFFQNTDVPGKDTPFLRKTVITDKSVPPAFGRDFDVSPVSSKT